MKPINEFYEKQAISIIKKLEMRNMEGYFFHTSNEGKKKIIELIEKGSTVSWGGSETLKEIGIIDELKNHDYKLIDRSLANTPYKVRETYIKAFDSDYYLTSTNAITLDGELINIDGNGNRVAALIYGPHNVIVVVGMNKVVRNELDGINRIKTASAPPNAIRVGVNTPCTITGKCSECTHTQTICCQTVITRFSRIPKRIKVILIGESLGF